MHKRLAAQHARRLRTDYDISFLPAHPFVGLGYRPRLRTPLATTALSALTCARRTVESSLGFSRRRDLHYTHGPRQNASPITSPSDASHIPPFLGSKGTGVRDRLRQWTPPEPVPEEKAALDQEREDVAMRHASGDYMRSDLQTREEEGHDDDTGTDLFTQEFDRMSGDYEGTNSANAFFAPGDIIELPGGGGGRPLFAVFLKNTQNYTLLYNQHGRIIVAAYNQCHFRSANQFSQKELAPLLAFVPKDPFTDVLTLIQQYSDTVPRSAGAQVLDKLQTFSNAVDEAFRVHSQALSAVHSLVADQSQAKTMQLRDIAAKVVGVPQEQAHTLPESLLLAVSFSCVRDAYGFKVASRTYARTRSLFVESRYSALAVERVVRWTRAYQDEASARIRKIQTSPQTHADAQRIHQFAHKARKLVEASKAMRVYSPHGAVIGTKPEYLKQPQRAEELIKTHFDGVDRDIIHFLSLFTAGRAFTYQPRIVAVPAIILRAVKGNEGFNATQTEVDFDAVHSLLVEMGVMQPFNNAEAIDRELVVHDEDLQLQLDAAQKQIDSGIFSNEAVGLSDTMAHMRRDWGNLPVYCIDSAATTEVDDGISVEDVSGMPGHVWVHVHSAHHSSYMSPEHLVARLAENRHSTSYLPEGKLSMSPEYIAERFSIQPHAPVLTISMHLSADGKLVDYCIRPGTVHNVQRISNDRLDSFFGHYIYKAQPTVMSIGGGAAIPDGNRSDSVSQGNCAIPVGEEHHESLQRLLSISKRLSNSRPGHNLRSAGIRSQANVTNQPRDPTIPTHHFQGSAYYMHRVPHAPSYSLRFPTMSMRINPEYENDLLNSDTEPAPSEILVTEIMILANIVAGRYAAERDLPLVFFGSAPAAEGIANQLPLMRERLRRMARCQEPVERGFLTYTRTALAIRQLSTRPIKHVPMGLEAYAKVTSPLRRNYDLVSMFQIDAALMYEHETGKSLKVSEMDTEWFAKPVDSASSSLDTERLGGQRKPGDALVEGAPSPPEQDKPFIPPFTHETLADLLDRTRYLELGQMRFLASHEKHFAIQLFGRALYLCPENIVPYYADGKRPSFDVLNPAEGRFVAIVGKSGGKSKALSILSSTLASVPYYRVSEMAWSLYYATVLSCSSRLHLKPFSYLRVLCLFDQRGVLSSFFLYSQNNYVLINLDFSEETKSSARRS